MGEVIQHRVMLLVDCYTESPETETAEAFVEDLFYRLAEQAEYDITVTAGWSKTESGHLWFPPKRPADSQERDE